MGAELAASRPICDAGWLPMERQVGSSGQTVAPKLYVAVGISRRDPVPGSGHEGRENHCRDQPGTRTRRSSRSPTTGLWATCFEVVPALIEEITKAH